jgi:hypothetical protein
MSGILDRLKTLYASTGGEGFAHHIETGEWDSPKPERRRLAASDAAAYIGASRSKPCRIGASSAAARHTSRSTRARPSTTTPTSDQWLDERRFTSTADEAAREGGGDV